MRDTRLHVEDRLEAGCSLELGAGPTHRLRAVLRARPGQTLRIFNAASGEWRARLDRLDRHEASVRVEERLSPPAAEPGPGPTLLFAPLKRPRLEWLLEKAVELGVARLQPVRCRHGVIEAVRPDRLRQRLIEAAEQCERLSLPTLLPEADLLDAVAGGSDILLADEKGGADLAAALERHPRAALLVGPEGGFAAEERAALRSLPHVHPVGLGATILRAETAALMMLACHRALAAGVDRARRPSI